MWRARVVQSAVGVLTAVVYLSQVAPVLAQSLPDAPPPDAPPTDAPLRDAPPTDAPLRDAPPTDAATIPEPPGAYQSGAAVPPPPPAPDAAMPPAPPAAAPPPARYPATPTAPGADAISTSGALTLTSPEPQLQVPAHIATRLRVLSHDLTTLGSRGGGSVADGAFSIVTGGVLIALGVFLASTDVGPLASPQLYVHGGTAVARGLIEIIVSPNPYDAMVAYGHMPMTNVAEVKLRLRYGEDALQSIAERSRLARVVDGSIRIAAGGILAGLSIAASNEYANRDTPEASSMSTVVLVIGLLGSAQLVVGGMISLFSSTDAERRWSAYEDMRDTMARNRAQERARQQRAEAPRMRVDAVLTPQLGMGILTVTL